MRRHDEKHDDLSDLSPADRAEAAAKRANKGVTLNMPPIKHEATLEPKVVRVDIEEDDDPAYD